MKSKVSVKIWLSISYQINVFVTDTLVSSITHPLPLAPETTNHTCQISYYTTPYVRLLLASAYHCRSLAIGQRMVGGAQGGHLKASVSKLRGKFYVAVI